MGPSWPSEQFDSQGYSWHTRAAYVVKLRLGTMRLATTIQSIQEGLKEDKALIKLKLGIPSVESSCLSVLALRRDPGFEEVVQNILALQNRDGSWPAIAADKPQGCWVTALAILCLLAANDEMPRLHNAVCWLLGAKRETAVRRHHH